MSLINSKFDQNNIHRFSHNAIATIFEIIIESEEKEYAEQAASEAFTEIDRLEEELSRFRPNSDVARINSLIVGEELRLSPDTFECLVVTNHLYTITKGLFDITAGQIIDVWKNKGSEIQEIENVFTSKDIGMDKIIIDEIKHSINVLSNDLLIDFGGFGKGYAIDVVCELLEEWEINNALVHSGGSTVKAIGQLNNYEGWPISISNPSNPSQTIAEIILKNSSLSGSGKQKGTHIINPITHLPMNKVAGAWAMAESAAKSDAMSTTFMIMPIEDITEFCNKNDFVAGMVVRNDVSEVGKNDLYISDNFTVYNILI